jgi:hypothetical protein
MYLTDQSTSDDLMKIVMFGSNVYKKPSAYEIHKDMLNVYHFTRFSKGSIKLTHPLRYYDQEIKVDNSELLGEPIRSRNIPGILYIEGEKIEYMQKNGNILSQLRRGSQGTSIALEYPIGSDVVDIGPSETVPYNETQERADFISDGSSLLVGPLEFIPITRKDMLGNTAAFTYAASIPDDYYPCDQIEVFAAGKRLRKDSLTVYKEELGASSPSADAQIEAEFSVDGTSNYIRLTTPLPAGTRISIISRTGRVWYNRADTTASKGLTLLENTTAMAAFIAQRTTKLPE